MSSRACSWSSTAPRRCARPSATCSASTRRCSAACVTRSATCSTTCPSTRATAVRRRLRAAWALDDHDSALERLRALADELARTDPGAAASLREGLEETLTVTRLGVRGSLKRTLASTNPCESMIETVRRISRNVKRWRNGDMCLRWTAAGMLEAETQFRRIIGHGDLAKLAVAVERDVAAKRAAHTPTDRVTRRSRPRRRRSPLHPPEIIHSQDRRREVPRRAGHPHVTSMADDAVRRSTPS